MYCWQLQVSPWVTKTSWAREERFGDRETKRKQLDRVARQAAGEQLGKRGTGDGEEDLFEPLAWGVPRDI